MFSWAHRSNCGGNNIYLRVQGQEVWGVSSVWPMCTVDHPSESLSGSVILPITLADHFIPPYLARDLVNRSIWREISNASVSLPMPCSAPWFHITISFAFPLLYHGILLPSFSSQKPWGFRTPQWNSFMQHCLQLVEMVPNGWEQERFLCNPEVARCSQDFGIQASYDIKDKPRISQGLVSPW